MKWILTYQNEYQYIPSETNVQVTIKVSVTFEYNYFSIATESSYSYFSVHLEEIICRKCS